MVQLPSPSHAIPFFTHAGGPAGFRVALMSPDVLADDMGEKLWSCLYGPSRLSGREHSGAVEKGWSDVSQYLRHRGAVISDVSTCRTEDSAPQGSGWTTQPRSSKAGPE